MMRDRKLIFGFQLARRSVFICTTDSGFERLLPGLDHTTSVSHCPGFWEQRAKRKLRPEPLSPSGHPQACGLQVFRPGWDSRQQRRAAGLRVRLCPERALQFSGSGVEGNGILAQEGHRALGQGLQSTQSSCSREPAAVGFLVT